MRVMISLKPIFRGPLFKGPLLAHHLQHIARFARQIALGKID